MRLLLQLMKKKLKLDEISAIKKERKKDGNRQTNKVTNTCMIHQGTKGTPYHRTWENCAKNGVSRHTKNYDIEHSIKINRHANAQPTKTIHSI